MTDPNTLDPKERTLMATRFFNYCVKEILMPKGQVSLPHLTQILFGQQMI
jgi:hypothetical protein